MHLLYHIPFPFFFLLFIYLILPVCYKSVKIWDQTSMEINVKFSSKLWIFAIYYLYASRQACDLIWKVQIMMKQYGLRELWLTNICSEKKCNSKRASFSWHFLSLWLPLCSVGAGFEFHINLFQINDVAFVLANRKSYCFIFKVCHSLV